MLEIFITAMLALGIITGSDQATQELVDQNKAEIEQYIIETDIEQM